MNGTFSQSMRWLHTWAGLTLGTVLYFMFITGTAGYFDEEITHWMQPEIPVSKTSMNQQQMLLVAQTRLNEIAPDAKEWWVVFPNGRGYALSVWWRELTQNTGNRKGKLQQEILNPQTGEPVVVRKTGGGRALYSMHYALNYMPKVIAYWITSLAALFMLVALISGIVIHKKIFKDLFTFRPGKNPRAWLDMHNILSVLPLPFHLMITYSGLVFLMFTSMQGVMNASYGLSKEGRDTFYDTIFKEAAHPEDSPVIIKGLSMSELQENIETHWGNNQIDYIGIQGRGTAGAHVEVSRQSHSNLSGEDSLLYHGISGELLHNSMSTSEPPTVSKQFYDVLTHLHEGLFAGTFLRWLYFLSGLMGAGMIATGMILWAKKRREKAQVKGTSSQGLVLVESLNIGTIVGLPIALAAYFWANRLIPANMVGREQWEIHSLFIAWAVMLLLPFLLAKKYSPHQQWAGQLSIAAIAYGLLPLLNIFSIDKHLAVSLQQQQWVMAGFDLCMLGFAVCFALAAYKIHRKNNPNISTINTTAVFTTSTNSLTKVKRHDLI
ncbi:PepSY-associated TM helix domain-containing protein [Shewanella sp. A14]